MAQTTVSDVFQPEILTEAVQAAFGQKAAFMGSRLASLGACVVEGTMPEGDRQAIGSTIKVPYFGTIGEFVNNPDGTALTPSKVQQTSESCTVTRDSLGFSVTAWARGNAHVNMNVGDPYQEAARQIVVAAERAMDKRIITAAGASGVYVKDVYSSTTPVLISHDLILDARFDGWGDEQDDLAGILMHSQAHKDAMKIKDGQGRPLLLSSLGEGGPLDTFAGLPVCVSDRVPVTGSTMNTAVSSGTSPPVLTLTGTPLGPWRLVIDCVVGGANATATIRFSTDGGNTWSATMTTLAAGVAQPLTDTAIGSQVGVNGATGISAAFASGTFNADNLYTSTASLKVMTLLLKKRALAFWYNKQALAMKQDANIRDDSDEAAMHLYAAAHRYSHLNGSSRNSGVIQVVHNVSGY